MAELPGHVEPRNNGAQEGKDQGRLEHQQKPQQQQQTSFHDEIDSSSVFQSNRVRDFEKETDETNNNYNIDNSIINNKYDNNDSIIKDDGNQIAMTRLNENGATANGVYKGVDGATDTNHGDGHHQPDDLSDGAITYINTKAGILKLLETFVGVVVIGCGCGATVTNASGSSLFFLIFVAVLSTLNALFSLLYFEYYGAPENRGLEMGETLFNALSSILNFVAAFVFLLTVTIDESIPPDGITIATLVFAWILFSLFLINFVICIKIQKRKSQQISTPEAQTKKQIPPQYDKVKY